MKERCGETNASETEVVNVKWIFFKFEKGRNGRRDFYCHGVVYNNT
jgi:hypothetical protein